VAQETKKFLNMKIEQLYVYIGGRNMKGYVIDSGYMGYVNGEYMLFADEQDYRDMYDEIAE